MKNGNKAVLVLTANFYPDFGGGVPRVAKFCTYLQDNGWQPTLICRDSRDPNVPVLTQAADPCEVVRVKDKRPYLQLPKWKRGVIMATRRWVRTTWDARYIQLEKDMYQEACRLCEERTFDAIFASSLPQYIHRIADKLHRRYGIPWVADFRDIAGQTPRPKRNWIRTLSEAADARNAIRLDARYARSAARLVTVSQGLAELLQARTGQKVDVIPNGFDPNDLPMDVPAMPPEKMKLVYAGTLWGDRNPKPLFHGLFALQKLHPKTYRSIEVVFYGPCQKEMTAFLGSAEYAPLGDVVHYGGMLPHEEALTRQMQADALYLITSQGKGIATGKVYEYMATGKPILAVPGDGDAADWLVTQSGLGVVASTPEAVAETLHNWYTHWAQSGAIPVAPNHAFIHRYTRQAQAKQLAELLNQTQTDR